MPWKRSLRVINARASSIVRGTTIVSAFACFSGCGEQPLEPVATPPSAPVASTANNSSPVADSVARGLSLALSDESVRIALRNDLRDSPFKHHALHLRSYLGSEHGSALLTVAAQKLGVSEAQFREIASSLPDMELLMERPVDQVNWKGEDNLVVNATLLDKRARARISSVTGFRSSGDSVNVPMTSFAYFPYLTLRPVSVRFGAQPEVLRRAAPRSSRPTISTPRLAFADGCAEEDPNCCPPNTDDCEPPIGTGGGDEPGGLEVSAQYTHYYCFGITTPIGPWEDLDHDGLRDDCETVFATTFYPELKISSYDRDPSMESYYSVAPNEATFGDRATVRIFYALGYHRDPGSPVGGSIDAHDGDSEFIIVGLHQSAENPVKWAVDWVTLSAHWGTGAATDHSATYSTDVLEWASDIYRGRPRVWVSTDKHANYRSRDVCMYMWNDYCGYEYSPYVTSGMWFGFEPAARNLGNLFYNGSDGRRITCNSSIVYDPGPQECGWWTNAPYNSIVNSFAGWHAKLGQATSTAYGTMLAFYQF